MPFHFQVCYAVEAGRANCQNNKQITMHFRYFVLISVFFFGLLIGSLIQNPAHAFVGEDLKGQVFDTDDKWSFYLPEPVSFRSDITAPSEMLGFTPGEWHVRHDQIVAYMQRLAEESDRVSISEYGRTWQERPLFLMTISDPVNLANIDSLRRNHLNLADPSVSEEQNIEEMPVVTWLGYSVHGNEPSGTNAALITAYYLAAGEGDKIEELLQESVILLDPAYNPDGIDRFASWVNNNRSLTPSGNPDHREHREPWPNSRTNHYWFDLNRDWMPVQHPESRGRIRAYQSWKPNVLTDHHEMGTQSTYFFQPGVPSRDNPLTPARTFELTGKLAEFHADYLNKVSQLYWTEEVFDDFYPGKGSTYPDLQGTIGILFEQASSRGHLQESQHGELSFPETVRNQFLTSLSTLYGAKNLRVELLDHLREFHRSALEQAAEYPVRAWVFGDPHDRARNYHLLDLLDHHKIEIYELAGAVEMNGQRFEPGSAWIVPAGQPQYRLARTFFETRTEFADSIFYDVSTWTLPLAFDIPSAELDQDNFATGLLGERLSEPDFPEGRLFDAPEHDRASGGDHNDKHYAYLFEWNEYYAPRAAYRLMDAGLRLKAGTRTFDTETVDGIREFDYGTILVSPAIQDEELDYRKIRSLMKKVTKEDGVDVYGVRTGLTPRGIDLGSPSFESLEKPAVLVITGRGVNRYEAGEIWHLLDQRYRMPVSMADMRYLNSVDLSGYNTVVMVHGNYSGMPETFKSDLKRWIEDGNLLIAQKNAIRWISREGWLEVATDSLENPQLSAAAADLQYKDISALRGSEVIGGVILQAGIDRSHPLGYGFKRNTLPVFRNSTLFPEMPENRFATPVRYSENPLLSGYVSQTNQKMLPKRPVVLVGRMGSGRVIMNTDNPNFRGFWYGTNRLFANSIYFGRTISRHATID